MKKICLCLTLLMSISTFSANAADLGGGYTNSDTLRADAHKDLISLLELKTGDYKDVTQKDFYERKLVALKKAINTFIYSKLQIKEMSSSSVYTNEDKSLGNALTAHHKGDSTMLKMWVNTFTSEHFEGLGELDFTDDVVEEEEDDDASDDHSGPVTAPPLPTTPAPQLPPAPVTPESDDDDDSEKLSSENEIDDLMDDKRELEGDLDALDGKIEKYRKKLAKAQKQYKKKKKSKYKKKIEKYEEKLEAVKKAKAKYEAKIEQLEAAIQAL